MCVCSVCVFVSECECVHVCVCVCVCCVSACLSVNVCPCVCVFARLQWQFIGVLSDNCVGIRTGPHSNGVCHLQWRGQMCSFNERVLSFL